MSNFEIGLWSFPVLLVLLFARIPIGLAMMAVGIGGSWAVTGTPNVTLGQMKHQVFGTFSSYSLSIIPLFLLMGHFATLSGMSAGLFQAARAFLGHRRGGVAMAAIGACAGFGAICGSSLATAATMGQVALPELKRAGYSGRLSTAALAAGGTLGILIPPSVILVIYAIIAEVNIAKLFAAALVPGILAALTHVIVVAIMVRLRPGDEATLPRVGMADRMRAVVQIWPVVFIFVAVVGGIYGGIFTPTEAAAVGAFATLVLALLRRRLGWRALGQAVLDTARDTAMIFFIVLGAGLFNGFLALSQVPQELAAWIGGIGAAPVVILLAVLLLYLVFGCVMDSLSMVLLTVPIFYPILSVLDFGLSPVEFGLWFGILVLIAVELGLITPPVGLNLFIINRMAGDVPLSETFRGAVPFVAAEILRIGVLVAFPVLSLGLVRMLS